MHPRICIMAAHCFSSFFQPSNLIFLLIPATCHEIARRQDREIFTFYLTRNDLYETH